MPVGCTDFSIPFRMRRCSVVGRIALVTTIGARHATRYRSASCTTKSRVAGSTYGIATPFSSMFALLVSGTYAPLRTPVVMSRRDFAKSIPFCCA